MTLIIAEAGVNHNGNEEVAFELIDKAKQAGADIVKFQTFKSKKLVTNSAEKASYQIKNTQTDGNQLSMLSQLELPKSAFIRLSNYCKKHNIEFLSTAFDSESLEFLVNNLNLKRLKVPSGELTNLPFILEHARTKLDIIISTGMANLSDIEQALAVIAFGLIADKDEIPSVEKFYHAYSSDEGQETLKKKVTILHCTTEYPAPLNEINLNAIGSLQHAFRLRTGYSDHSEGITVAIAAAAKGACVIEKHFTLDRNMEGPDHKASLEPAELKNMIDAIRGVELALGDGIKRAFPSEIKNRKAARKSLVAAKKIKKGQIINKEDLAIKRPGEGRSPMEYYSILGSVALNDYEEDEIIR
jgi:N-acetylneuraminate synthase